MKKYSILLVDDEEIICKTIGDDLIDAGYDVTLARSGKEALRLFFRRERRSSFDLVITDLIMEGIGGIKVLERVKKLSPATMVMILTGHGDVQSAIKALRLNADDYVLKPCDSEELRFRVAQCLKRFELKRKVKLYEKILPVCCVCKKIRDDEAGSPGKGKWLDMAVYIEKRAKVDVTHGYCSDCLKSLFKDGHPEGAKDSFSLGF